MTYFWPLKASLSGPDKWLSEGARSELYGGCSNTSNTTSFDRSPRPLFWMAGFSLPFSILMQQALIMFQFWFRESQETVSIRVLAVSWVLGFLLTSGYGCFHSILWHLLSKDGLFKERLMFFNKAIQKPRQISKPFVLCNSASRLGPSSTNFTKVKSVMDDITGTAVPSLQIICHFINSYRLVTKPWHGIINVVISSGCDRILGRPLILQIHL